MRTVAIGGAVLVLALAVVGGALAAGASNEEAAKKAEELRAGLMGKPAPDFELATLDGGKFKLSELKDKKIVVIDFWATWCPPCRKALPVYAEVTGGLKDKDVVFCAVNLREDAAKVKAFLEAQKLAVQVALDKDGSTAALYGVYGIPQSVVIGKDGTVQSIHVGMAADLKDKITKELQTLIDGKKLVEAPAGAK